MISNCSVRLWTAATLLIYGTNITVLTNWLERQLSDRRKCCDPFMTTNLFVVLTDIHSNALSLPLELMHLYHTTAFTPRLTVPFIFAVEASHV
jgi:hypothetical protein